MSVLERIAFLQGRRDEKPNQLLAGELVSGKNLAGIREIAENLRNKDPNIQSDCVKVLYEIGYLSPELVAPYVSDFMELLEGRNNRLVWGSMLALATVATLKAEELYPRVDMIRKVMARGSVIAVDNGVKVLAAIASAKREYSAAIFPHLLDHLSTCRPKEVAQHAEGALAAVDGENKGRFIEVINKRMEAATEAQKTRLRKVVRAADSSSVQENRLRNGSSDPRFSRSAQSYHSERRRITLARAFTRSREP